MINEYYVCGDEVFIKLVSRKHGVEWTIIDLENLDLVDKFKGAWQLKISTSSNTMYVIGNKSNLAGRYYLHRIICNLSSDDFREPDHEDRNGLNNRKNNLRVVTRSINNFNKKLQSNNKSGISGVSYREDIGKWQATIKINNKKIYLGCFYYKKDAVEARSKAEDAYLL